MIKLSAPLTDWRSTIIKWASELRRIPFVFRADRRLLKYDPIVKMQDSLGAQHDVEELIVHFAYYRELENHAEILIMLEGNIATPNPASIKISVPTSVIKRREGTFYKTIFSTAVFAVFGGTPCTARCYLQADEKYITVDGITVPLAVGRLQVNVNSFIFAT